MRFKLMMSCDGAAFEGEPGPEVARILRAIAAKVDDWNGYDKYQTVFDINGNDVGRWKLGQAGLVPREWT